MHALGSLSFGSPQFQFFTLNYSQTHNPQTKWFNLHNNVTVSTYICAELINIMLQLPLPSTPLEIFIKNLQLPLDILLPIAIQKMKGTGFFSAKNPMSLLAEHQSILTINQPIQYSSQDLINHLKNDIFTQFRLNPYYWIFITANKHTTCVFVRNINNNVQLFYFNPQKERFYFLDNPHGALFAYLADNQPVSETHIDIFLRDVILSRCESIIKPIQIQFILPKT